MARTVSVVALLAIAGVFADGLWTTAPENVRAQVTLHDLRPGPEREVGATVRIDPPQAAEDPAWLNVTAWQGGGLVVNRLAARGNGVYRTTEPIPVHGDWKASIRLQRGREILGLPVYMPEDTAIPAPKVPAKQSFTRPFVNDSELLQREQKPGVPGWLTTGGPSRRARPRARLPGGAGLGARQSRTADCAPDAFPAKARAPFAPHFDPLRGAAVTQRRQCIIGVGGQRGPEADLAPGASPGARCPSPAPSPVDAIEDLGRDDRARRQDRRMIACAVAGRSRDS